MQAFAADAESSPLPSLRHRILGALVIGALAALFAWFTHPAMLRDGLPPDSLVLWRGARILLAGQDPYSPAAWSAGPPGELDLAAWRTPVEALYYPLPAILLWVPFGLGSFLAGSIAFTAIGAALFAFAISRRGLQYLWLCGGVPFIVTLRFGQWSTWLVAAALYPALAMLLVAKPNIGAALALMRPSRRVILLPLALVMVSLIVAPRWPLRWWANITGEFGRSAPHPAPALLYGGAGVLVVLLAALRWRRTEARLVALLACVPQLPFWSDQLALALVPATRREIIWSVLAGHLGLLAWLQFAPKVTNYVPVMQPYALAGTYLPVVIILMRRTNRGAMPVAIERMAAFLPAWLRGDGSDAAEGGQP